MNIEKKLAEAAWLIDESEKLDMNVEIGIKIDGYDLKVSKAKSVAGYYIYGYYMPEAVQAEPTDEEIAAARAMFGDD